MAVGTEEAKGSAQLPRLELDDLLAELQIRVETMRGTRDRVHQLLEAVLTVGQGLDPVEVMRRIVEAAATLVDARHGALAVIGKDWRLARLVTFGMGAEEVRDGVMGDLIRRSETGDHPPSSGLPVSPRDRSRSLTVPITVRDEAFGNLCLTEKAGGQAFDTEDQAVLSTLAVAAGIAIENVRLYDETRVRQNWLEAGAKVTRALLSGVDDRPVLELIVECAREILDAQLGAVAFPTDPPDGLRVDMAMGKDAEAHHGLLLPVTGTFMGLAFRSEEPVHSADIAHDPRVTVGPPRWAGLGPAVAAPLGTGNGVRGVLLLARSVNAPTFTTDEIAPLLGFAGQAALAMELADRRRNAEQIALFEDRDRIARDLHDLAIQRLFATGMTLQSALRFASHPQAAERLTRAVDDLDETIKIIRSTIFGLRTHETDTPASGLRARAVHEMEEASAALGFAPTLLMEGLIDTEIPDDVADDVVAVLVEALSNVSRHAHATSARVSLATGSEACTVTVEDNGVGMTGGGRRSGLINLAERAEKLGGTVTFGRPPGGGTRLVWRVPLTTPGGSGVRACRGA